MQGWRSESGHLPLISINHEQLVIYREGEAGSREAP